MNSIGQNICLLISIAFFVIGGGISLSRLRWEKSWSRIAAKACLYFGVSFAIAVLIWHSISRRNWLLLDDNFAALVWLAVVLVFFVLYVQRRKPLGGLDWFIMPIVVLLLIGAAATGLANPSTYNVHGLVSWMHLLTSYGGAAAFAVAAAAGTMYLIANYRLRHKVALAGPNLGSLERLEHLTLSAVTLGFALLTIGAVTGFMKMKFEHRSAPAAKVILSLGVWIVYALVLHSPINPSFRGRRAAVLSIIGFVLMIGTIVAVVLMPSG
ncbi:MAG TPA: cytochrome c biogenesis protein CcsA [Tepidisphaeraceae bacterium]|nr:cytochrome c biogenesis protein CcsA [Tepidisphaeraceae bacterium]